LHGSGRFGMLRAMWPAFGIGNVLGTGFKVWFKNLAPFLLMFSIIELPYLAYLLHTSPQQADLLRQIGEHPHDPDLAMSLLGDTMKLLFIGFFVGKVLEIFASAVVTYGVVMDLSGKRAGMIDCVTTGVRRLLPALGVGALCAICCVAGYIALIIPGIILSCGLWVATQASVIEKPGLFGALSRSFALTKGHRFEIFAIVIIMGIGTAVVNKILQMIVVPGDVVEQAANYDRVVYLQWVTTVVIGSLSAVLASVAYYYLRAEKEGTSATELASVFD
jgi:hypothetical protein